MSTMFVAGAICWAFEILAVAGHVYTGRDMTTRRSFLLKVISAAGYVIYAGVLISLYDKITPGALTFLFALVFSFLGDTLFGLMPYVYGGSLRKFYGITDDKPAPFFVAASLGFVFYIISCFLEMIVFLGGMGDDAGRYVVFFIILFLIPIVLMAVIGIISRYKLPDVPTRVFIVAFFYALLISGLFSATFLYGFWFSSMDYQHGLFIQLGAFLFMLAGILHILRYSATDTYETPAMRAVSRVIYFTSQMILAGCAFLF